MAELAPHHAEGLVRQLAGAFHGSGLSVVFKLHWFRLGGEVSERQWADVLGILRLKQSLLDLEYARRWSKHFRVEDLLELALQAAKGL